MSVHAFRRSDDVRTSCERRVPKPHTIKKSLGDILQIMAATAPHLIASIEEYAIDMMDASGPPNWWA